MVTKLISIFTAAGVVAAGSVAYAINAQSLKSQTKSPVGTATMDMRENQVIIKPTKPVVVLTVPKPASDARTQTPTAEPTVINQPMVTAAPEVSKQQSDDSAEPTSSPTSDPTRTPAPVVTPSKTADPVLPSPPPGYKPGQGDDEGDEDGDDDDDEGDHEDSQDSHDSWEHDDD